MLPLFDFHVLSAFNLRQPPLVDAARCGERGVFGQRRVVLHGVGRVGDECCKLRKVTCGEVFLNW